MVEAYPAVRTRTQGEMPQTDHLSLKVSVSKRLQADLRLHNRKARHATFNNFRLLITRIVTHQSRMTISSPVQALSISMTTPLKPGKSVQVRVPRKR